MAATHAPQSTLVTGGVRSGKSRHAESLLEGWEAVTYVAPGPSLAEDSDPDWAVRVHAHQAARPAHWTTWESRDLAAALALPGPVIVDCLGTWLSGFLDAEELWDAPADVVSAAVGREVDRASTALAGRPTSAPLVLVTNEVGLGVVPSHRSGRLFRDLLGTVNQRLAGACDEVHLVIAGRVLRL